MLRLITLRPLALLLLLPLWFSAAHAAAAGPGEVAIVSADFGIFEDDGSDQLGFGATSTIPLVPGQSYGWLMEVKTTRKSVAVREELAAARDASENGTTNLDPALQASSGPLLAFSERRVPVMDGMLFAQRKVLAGDRPGRFLLRVYVEKQLAAVFRYEIAASTAEAGQASPQATPRPAKVPRARMPKDPAGKKP